LPTLFSPTMIWNSFAKSNVKVLIGPKDCKTICTVAISLMMDGTLVGRSLIAHAANV
jgi:hypothetical protein